MSGHVDAFFERFHEGADLAKGRQAVLVRRGRRRERHERRPQSEPREAWRPTRSRSMARRRRRLHILRRAARARRRTPRGCYEEAGQGRPAAAPRTRTSSPEQHGPHAETLQSAAPKGSRRRARGAERQGRRVPVSSRPTRPRDVPTGKFGTPTLSEQQRFSSIADTVLHPELALSDLAKALTMETRSWPSSRCTRSGAAGTPPDNSDVGRYSPSRYLGVPLREQRHGDSTGLAIEPVKGHG